MDNSEILESLDKEKNESALPEESEERRFVKFLVFLIGKRRLAIEAEKIREIVLDLPVFFIPFVPAYVRGVINRHGEPYTVLDIHVLFEQELLDSSTLLIMSDTSNPAAFLISDVLEIVLIDESKIYPVSDKDDTEEFVQAIIPLQDNSEILVVDSDAVFQRLERDVSQ